MTSDDVAWDKFFSFHPSMATTVAAAAVADTINFYDEVSIIIIIVVVFVGGLITFL